MHHRRVVICEKCPELSDYAKVLLGCSIEVDRGVAAKLSETRASYESVAGKARIYGLDTGVGQLQTKVVDPEAACRRLVLEHAAGVGELLSEEASRLVVFVRMVQLTRGSSPVRPCVVEFLARALSEGVVPAIPRYGSVGASGDLAPLAHAALIFLKLGEVWYRGRLMPAREALDRAGLEPPTLRPGEALSLINGTAFSTGVLIYALLELKALLEVWAPVMALEISLLTKCPEHYMVEVLEAKKHALPVRLIECFAKLVTSGKSCELQDPYSLRCTPLVLSAVYTCWQHVASVALSEACSPSDNPLVLEGRVVHQCGFHGLHVALAADYLALAMAALANISERRVAQVVSSSSNFLGDDSSPSGYMLLHYVAASRAAVARQRASPNVVHSLPTSGLQEDFVSMSANSALNLLDLVEVLKDLASIELVATARLCVVRGCEVPKRLRELLDPVVAIVKEAEGPHYLALRQARELLNKAVRLRLERCACTDCEWEPGFM